MPYVERYLQAKCSTISNSKGVPSIDIHPYLRRTCPAVGQTVRPTQPSLSSPGMVGRRALRSQWGWVCTTPPLPQSAAGRCLHWSNASRCCRPCSPESWERRSKTGLLTPARVEAGHGSVATYQPRHGRRIIYKPSHSLNSLISETKVVPAPVSQDCLSTTSGLRYSSSNSVGPGKKQSILAYLLLLLQHVGVTRLTGAITQIQLMHKLSLQKQHLSDPALESILVKLTYGIWNHSSLTSYLPRQVILKV